MKHEEFLTKAKDFTGSSILVVGDIMLDVYNYGTVSKISPEAPIPVMDGQWESTHLGGAANVAMNLKSLGCDVYLVGVVGEGPKGKLIKQMLENEGIGFHIITATCRPTTIKTRFIGNDQQIMRFDVEDTSDILHDEEKQIIDCITSRVSWHDAVVLCDYGKGVLTKNICQDTITYANGYGKKILVDPTGTDFSKYTDAYLVKPNKKEWKDATFAGHSFKTLVQDNHIKNLVVTLGSAGMRLFNKDCDIQYFPTEHKEVFDVCGAGDTVIATLAACLSVNMTLEESIKIANVAGGIVVGKQGTATTSTFEISNILYNVVRSYTDLASINVARKVWRSDRKRVGFTNGCFDLIHPGHLHLLETAKQNCDKLIVGINSDKSIKRIKGEDRPLQDEKARAIVLNSLSCVDGVVIFDEDDPLNTITTLKPDVIFKGADYTIDTIIGAKEVHSYGGEVDIIPLKEGFSTTKIVENISIPDK